MTGQQMAAQANTSGRSTASDICSYLDWDSAFFDKRIARANCARLDQSTVSALLDWCGHHRIDCLYLLADSDDAETARIARQNDFREVDVRLTLECPISHNGPTRLTQDSRVRLARESDLTVLRQLASHLHRDSRFYFDQHFDRDKCGCFTPPGLRKVSAIQPKPSLLLSWMAKPWATSLAKHVTMRRRLDCSESLHRTRARVSAKRWCNNSSSGPRYRDLVVERSSPRNVTSLLRASIDIADLFRHPFSVGITAGIQTTSITTNRRNLRCLQP